MFGSMFFRPRVFVAAAALIINAGAINMNPVSTCEAGERNSAFVFIKPHANTPQAQSLVKSTLTSKGIRIEQEGELTAEQIDKGMLIDQHYYAIASKATLLKPKDIPVPAKKFEEFFGISWEKALKDNLAYNALDACTYFGINAAELSKLWASAKKVKFGGGFYCGLVEVPGRVPIYVFNAFFMDMRAGFVIPGTSIHYYVVNFEKDSLSWKDFRGSVLGPTDPKDAPEGSLRATIYKDWIKLGLKAVPNTGDNGVHASASPFEGLAEKMNWLKVDPKNDDFGKKLIAAGVAEKTIREWSVDPQVKGKSLFDQLEDLDASACVEKSQSLAK
jgi:hypothetical protein